MDAATSADNLSIHDNDIGLAGNGNDYDGIVLSNSAAYVEVKHNRIQSNNGAGVALLSNAGTENRITENDFKGNAGIPIDLGDDGPTANDANDVDTGPNGRLNFPVIDPLSVNQDGQWTFNATLDLPSSASPRGYYVEYYRYVAGTSEYVYLSSQNITVPASGDLAFQGQIVYGGAQGLGSGDKFVALVRQNDGVTSELSFPEIEAVDHMPPTITSVTVRSTGSAHYPGGYAIPVGSGEQIRTIPIGGGIDEILVQFSEHVGLIIPDQTVLLSGNGGAYSIITSYESSTYLLTIHGFGTIQRDQVTVRLEADHAYGIRDREGLLLDGEWDNPAALSDTGTSVFPSGNGAQGGDFVFNFTVLLGDGNRDNRVTGADYTLWADNFGQFAGNGDFAHADWSGDGYVTGADYTLWADAFGLDFRTWPGGESMAFGAGATGGSAARDFLFALYTSGEREWLKDAEALLGWNQEKAEEEGLDFFLDALWWEWE